MAQGPPALIAINHDGYRAEHVGRIADGRQLFLTTPFEPAIGGTAGNEFVALYLFDPTGKLLEAKTDAFGPRATPDDGERRQVYDRRIQELDDVSLERIEVTPFALERLALVWPRAPRA